MKSSPDISGRAFLTPAQVAELLQLDTESVYRLVKRGQLPCVRVGGRTLRIPARPLFAQLQATRSGPTQQGAIVVNTRPYNPSPFAPPDWLPPSMSEPPARGRTAWKDA